jgi:hypothetical protein
MQNQDINHIDKNWDLASMSPLCRTDHPTAA